MSTLAIHHPATFWPNRRWPEFARMPDKARVVCVLPVCGFAEVADDLPFDAGETVATSLLREAAAAADFPLLVLPPLRFTPAPAGAGVFAVGVPTALRVIDELAASVRRPGFRKLALFNAWPCNEPLVDVAARDLRIALGLQMFCLNLSGLGLGLDDERGRDRFARLARHLLGVEGGTDGAGLLAEEARHLCGLLREVAERAPLPEDGVIPGMIGS